MGYGHREKRNFARAVVDQIFNYVEIGKNSTEQARVKNLSGQGLMFVASRPLAAGTTLKATIKPKNSLTPPLTLVARVVRSTPNVDGTSYEIGAVIEKTM